MPANFAGVVFLNASRSSGVAAAGWRGRGFCTDPLIALSASQPRWGKTAASPSSPAIQAATFGLVHKPPSGGGSRRRALSFSSRSGLRTEGLGRSGAADRPEPADPGRYSGRADVPPSAAQTRPWPRPRPSRGLWPEARWSESAVPWSRPCRTGTAAQELKHSDDPPHAPWFASATHGPSVYPQPQPSGIPADPFSRSPYEIEDHARKEPGFRRTEEEAT